MPTCLKCEQSFPNYVTIEGIKRNISKRRFCLTCSPFGCNNRKDLLAYSKEGKTCCGCQQFKKWDEFYKPYGKRNKTHSYCKACQSFKTRERFRIFKQKCVDYKGGKCIRCGYNKYIGALEFHHKDPKEKDFLLSKVKNSAFNDRIKRELDKCDILCSNCHKETHNELVSNGSII